jgi:hypothetical protein
MFDRLGAFALFDYIATVRWKRLPEFAAVEWQTAHTTSQ